ncbi:MAG: TonB family protein [Xenococcus sp. MO_188.B8]|nr:TonB family protein [Xenococcus sp. MO_188.B8]
MSAKPSQSDRFIEQMIESKLRRNPILLFVLASVLVHVIGLILFALMERSQPKVQLRERVAPIDFVVVPPEDSSAATPTDPLPQEETQPNKVKDPEPPTPETIEPSTPSQAVAVPETIPEPAPTEPAPPKEIPAPTPPPPEPPVAAPKPITESVLTEPQPPKEIPAAPPPPPEPIIPPSPANTVAKPENSAEILSGSDAVFEETETKIPEITKSEKSPISPREPENRSLPTRLPPKISPTQPLATAQPTTLAPEPENSPENSSVATRLPPKITPTQPSATNQPVTPPSVPNKKPTTSGAASLLGGNLKRSFEDDGGESFFNLENNARQLASNPALNSQQSLDMRKYFAEIQRRVRRNWHPKYAAQEYTTVLSFSIQRNGQITLLSVSRTSGSPEVDREALEAVQDSGPFDPLPANFPADMLNVEFNFNIYIY